MTYACAFCGEDNELAVDESGGRRQSFVEDCTVCCRPNRLTLTLVRGGVELCVEREYEA
jgi:hypothetical protein